MVIMAHKCVKILNGSRLYGTHNEDSDYDYIHIYIPSYRDVILGRGDSLGNIEASDNDDKHMSIYKFLDLLKQGQTVAIECLFAPLTVVETNSPYGFDIDMWQRLRRRRKDLIAKGAKAMLGYCTAQAYKYCNKTNNLNVYEDVLTVIKNHLSKIKNFGNSQNKLRIYDIYNELELLKGVKVFKEGKHRYIDVLGAKFIETFDLDAFKRHIEDKIGSYSVRTLQAKETGGKDWKALSHALRVGFMLEELHRTKDIEFPLAKSILLKNIKYGEVSYGTVLTYIEEQVNLVEGLDFSDFVYDNEFVEDWLFKLVTFSPSIK
jgi:predicted nucleotidyltransferase